MGHLIPKVARFIRENKMSTNNLLNPPSDLVQSVPSTQSTVSKVESSITALNNLPSESSPYVPSLGSDIQTAKSHGANWDNTVLPAIDGSLDAVQSWNGTFDSVYDNLLAAAQEIAENNAEGVDNFKSQLTTLQSATKTLSDKVSKVQPLLSGFLLDINNDVRAFHGDAQQAQSVQQQAYANQQAARQKLQRLYAEKAAKERQLDSLGPLSALAKAIEQLIETITGQINDEQKTMSQAQQQYQQAMQAAQIANQTMSVANAYVSDSSSISNSVNQALDGWETLESNFNVLLESEDISTFNVFTQDVLASVKADWQNLANQAVGTL